ncbi:hypothetical protein DDU33_01355 [Actinobacillus porcitonsillarum]|uniref:DUF2142 domain-containing protein n=1 Tax=Actinobacillus porcitonsillarum TaxID=189834 RepID=A0A2U8FGX4_9PAST|nr:DUF2142 domain-containing protein [Actinobacillus porcitonsillarum]AWI50231.1 hypothetical protein DDU33_01355 [Actinobacillus porcitonsillarum]
MLKKLNLENNSFNRLFLFGFTLVVLMVSILTPPFQSPDEFKHFERAYTIANGQFFLDKKGTGRVDNNLLQFESLYNSFPFKYEKKNTFELETDARRLDWSSESQNVSLVNTAVYFPIPYIPQAVGIYIGNMLDFSIYDSYRISKLIGIFSCLILIFVANKIYPITPAVYFILTLPMTIFQMSSTTPDGIIFALSLVLGSLISRGINQDSKFSISHFILICITYFIICTMKINIIPILIIILMVCHHRKLRCGYRFFFITIFFILGWILFSYTNFLSGEHFSQDGLGTTDKIKYYLAHTNEFIQIFVNTFSSVELIGSHLKQFIGVLGWLDTPLSSEKYTLLLCYGACIMVLSLNSFSLNIHVFLKVFTLLSLVLFTYFLLLLTWTPITEKVIHGVQGRYFIPIAIIFGYMLHLGGSKLSLAKIIVLLSLISSSIFTISAINYRYLLS